MAVKSVDTLHLYPSQSFEPLAQAFYHHMPLAARSLMRLLGISPKDDAALTSYILFEPNYIHALINLGYLDAQERESELRSFLE